MKVVKMCSLRWLFFVALLSLGLDESHGDQDVESHFGHRLRSHKSSRRHRATNDGGGGLRFISELYNKKLELGSSGKIHCKVAGGASPNVQWFSKESGSLPEGMTSVNGTLLVSEASRAHAGQYTCKATDGDHSITANITLDIVVSPRVVEPSPGSVVQTVVGQTVSLDCRATGDPAPTTHWDRNLTILQKQQNGVDDEDGLNATDARFVLLKNASLLIRDVRESDSDRYGCTAGSAAGLARNELILLVHPEGELPSQESSGVGGKAVVVSISVAGAYMILVLALMLYCRKRRLQRRERGEKLELELAEGREKLVEETEEDKKTANGSAALNGRLMPHDRDSGADNSEVSAISRASKKSNLYEHLTVSRSLITDQITLGRGEFGDVMLGNIDMCQLRRRPGTEEGETKVRPVAVIVLTTKDERQLSDFRRQLELASRIRHDHVARLLGLCNEALPHYMLLQHTDWGDLHSFLEATRTPVEIAEYTSRAGPALPAPRARRSLPALVQQQRVWLAEHLASAGACLAKHRLVHRDIAARNCVITSKLQLKLSFLSLTRGPFSHHYHKLHDQVIPLRWLPSEAVLEGDYSTKSDVYSFAATVWEIYTKAELPFAKLNDNSVLERLKNNSLEWTIPSDTPEKLADLLKRCWSTSPTERPQFEEVHEIISGMLKEIASENASMQSQEKLHDKGEA